MRGIEKFAGRPSLKSRPEENLANLVLSLPRELDLRPKEGKPTMLSSLQVEEKWTSRSSRQDLRREARR